MSETPTFLTIPQTAHALAVSAKTVRRMISRGDLPAVRISRQLVRIPASALETVGRDLAVSAHA